MKRTRLLASHTKRFTHFARNAPRFSRNAERFARNAARLAQNAKRFARNANRFTRNAKRFTQKVSHTEITRFFGYCSAFQGLQMLNIKKMLIIHQTNNTIIQQMSNTNKNVTQCTFLLDLTIFGNHKRGNHSNFVLKRILSNGNRDWTRERCKTF